MATMRYLVADVGAALSFYGGGPGLGGVDGYGPAMGDGRPGDPGPLPRGCGRNVGRCGRRP